MFSIATCTSAPINVPSRDEFLPNAMHAIKSSRASAGRPSCKAHIARSLPAWAIPLHLARCGRSVFGPGPISIPQSHGTVDFAAWRAYLSCLP